MFNLKNLAVLIIAVIIIDFSINRRHDFKFIIAMAIVIFAVAVDMIFNSGKSKYNSYKLTKLSLKLKTFLESKNICESHGLKHMFRVMVLCENACIEEHDLSNRTKHLICCAGLLHDVDDKKLFPESVDYDNLRLLMKSYPKEDVDLVVEMVSYVSSSINGDTVPKNAIENPWLLYPRHADRIEAIGKVGMIRCYQYNSGKKHPLFTEKTTRAINEKDLWENIATKERYNLYNGSSESMVDHYYDKLLRLGMFETSNKYLNNEKNNKIKPMVDFVLHFGETGEINYDMLNNNS